MCGHEDDYIHVHSCFLHTLMDKRRMHTGAMILLADITADVFLCDRTCRWLQRRACWRLSRRRGWDRWQRLASAGEVGTEDGPWLAAPTLFFFISFRNLMSALISCSSEAHSRCSITIGQSRVEACLPAYTHS